MKPIPKEWQLQEAKNKLSHVVREADRGIPQYITVHGRQAAVILSAADYKRLVQPTSTLSEALLLPLLDSSDSDLFERSQDLGRDIDL